MRALLLVVGCLGCVGSPPADPPDAGVTPEPYEQTLPDGPCAIENVTGTVVGATLSIRSASCVYRQGETATLTYELTLGGATPTIVIPADPPGGCGTCVSASDDPLSYLWPVIEGMTASGDSQLFCPGVSLGCCAPHPELTFQLAGGTYTRTVAWDGRELDCPSDVGPQRGTLFPPGRYEVRGEYNAYNAGTMRATLPIEMLAP